MTYPSPHGEGLSFLPYTWLSLTTWGRSQAFFPLKCKAIVPRTGKESCLLPRSASFPSFSPKCNTTLLHKSFPILNAGDSSSPFKMQKPPQILPYKSLFFMLILFIYICIYLFFIYLFIYYFVWIFFSFFPPKACNSSPKWKNYSLAFGANNRRIDAPAYDIWSIKTNL